MVIGGVGGSTLSYVELTHTGLHTASCNILHKRVIFNNCNVYISPLFNIWLHIMFGRYVAMVEGGGLGVYCLEIPRALNSRQAFINYSSDTEFNSASLIIDFKRSPLLPPPEPLSPSTFGHQ